MKEPLSTLLAFLTAPVPAAIAGAVTSPGLGGGFDAPPRELLLLAGIIYLYVLPFTAIFGVPLFALVQRFWRVSLWSAMLGGLVAGAVGIEVFSGRLSLDDLPVVSLWSAVGSFCGAVFWSIWRLGVPRNPPSSGLAA